ncbi:hypothetical protein A2115_03475 [Candidatus Woesebacteria bacterium GWA1_41_8]|uniref:Glycosyltransferase 2-like domain-containing protein n=1 Tax=Candidatus Woesebacteria bacterium GWA1_41_8 TaxID=1802471 RepID=A0A1F7WM93_9BACT|nr:MAG: hypothetical protein A2115_03475 [Candidatus Woesebacteria bacterium GWA1_41_8]
MKLSVVVPFFNEEENLGELHKELVNILDGIDLESEIVYVDDGSTDLSVSILQKSLVKSKSPRVSVKIVRLRRNFGQTAAVSAGIDNSSGELVSFLDADLQNDPRDIPRFLQKLNEGYDAVFGWRKEKKFSSSRRFYSGAANKIINIVFSYPFHDVGCSARVVKKEYLKGLDLFGELHRILPVLVYLKGAKISEVVVKHRARKAGKSKYGYARIIKTAIDLITIKFLHSYGTKPAYVFGGFGIGSIFLGGITLLAVAYRKLFLGVFVHRDPLFLITVFLILLGVQFILMGLLAELMVRTYFGSSGKPTYDIKETLKY